MSTTPLYPDDAVLLAPLSGYTDTPFRLACRAQGCRYAFTQMIDAGSLVHRNPRNATLLHANDDEEWLGTQLLGADPERLAKATELLRSYRHDVIDLNLGCPVPKVTKRGAGAALGQDLDRARRCIEAVVEHAGAPVSAKIRVLSADDPTPTVRLATALRDAGIVALTIHGREWAQVYSGAVAADVITAVREALDGIPVIANGGVFSARDAAALRRATGCSRIMVARGTIGNPWLFRELTLGKPVLPPSDELCDVLDRHVRGMVQLYGENRGMRHGRKIISAYLSGRGYRREQRGRVTSLSTIAEFAALLAELRAEGPSPQFRPNHDLRVRGDAFERCARERGARSG